MAEESAWFKSSYSNDTGGACVEIANLTSQVGIRDSKNKKGPALVVPTGAWSSFIGLVRAGDVDFGVVEP
ncbi:DUF397 domain-containing protein [Streptomyces sp. NBC_00322]|uniref:DUF397 domain-containing protein n=1 Tax=Streptomyces sp. NBC_00322 TaxID=2975712 RepID=UPI002E2A5A6C|nr:DUF397 domain-containing protein [Streptomyces sp. NBC_00322]